MESTKKVSKSQKSTGSPAAELGRRGGRIGGRARAELMSPEERREAAQLAAQARWDELKGVQRAICDGTLNFAGTELDCAVLPGEIRVLSQRTVAAALGRFRPGGRAGNETGGLPVFVAAKNLQPFITDEVRNALTTPILYRRKTKSGGQPAQGIEASVLADICVVFIEAAKHGVLAVAQKAIAKQAEVLHRALAKTAIVALVDEATGYQYERERNALAHILEQFVAKELAVWAKTFDDDFYKELCRLRDIETDVKKRKPQYFGHLTNNIIYARLAPGVKEALQKKNPADESGHRKHKHHQWLTPDKGHPKLKEHLVKVTTVMKLSSNYDEFLDKLDRIAPKYGASGKLPGVD